MDREFLLRQIQNLDWHLPEEIQKVAIDHLVRAEPEMSDFIIQELCNILAQGDKSLFENAVETIMLIGYPGNEKALSSLVCHLMDLNWPGVPKAIETLKSIEMKILIPIIEQHIQKAYENQDYMWLGGINYFLKGTGVTEADFNDLETYKLLSFADF